MGKMCNKKMKTLYILFLVVFILPGCDEKDYSQQFIDEPENPGAIVPTQAWEMISAGLHAMWGSTDVKYHKDYIPGKENSEPVKMTGWKNERVYAQMVIWSKDTVNDIVVSLKPLLMNGSVIDTGSIRCFFVRNVLTDEFLKGCGPREKNPENAHISPDVLESMPAYSNPARCTRGIWFTIDIPKEASSGTYKSEVEITVKGKILKTLPVSLEVINKELPDPGNWAFHLDLWQNPYAVPRLYNVELWSEEHFEAMKPLYQMLANAGQKCITATITHRPWRGQTYDPYGSMVSHIRKSDGTWSFNYTVFDKWVDFMMKLGVNKQINCYSIISKDGNYYYYDESVRDTIMMALIPGTTEYEDFWKPFLIDFNEHILKSGLSDITTIAMDERPPEHMLPAITLIQNYAPDLKITLATDLKNDYSDAVHDLSIGLKHLSIKDIIPIRRNLDVITTFYVSCSSHYPNNFTFSMPAEGTWMGWYAFANNLNGFLRWAYNSWVEEPLYDSRFRTWPAGDAYLVYPGPKSSIRFEKIREGVQDYEKLRIIKEFLRNSSSPESAQIAKELESHLEYFKEDFPEQESITVNVTKAKEWLNESSKKLFNP